VGQAGNASCCPTHGGFLSQDLPRIHRAVVRHRRRILRSAQRQSPPGPVVL